MPQDQQGEFSGISSTKLISTEVRQSRSLKHELQLCSRTKAKQRTAVLVSANSKHHFIACLI